MLSSWMRPRWYWVSIAPSTPPRSLRRTNSSSTASSTSSVSSLRMKAPWVGFSLRLGPNSLLMIIWIARARRTLSRVGVVTASS